MFGVLEGAVLRVRVNESVPAGQNSLALASLWPTSLGYSGEPSGSLTGCVGYRRCLFCW